MVLQEGPVYWRPGGFNRIGMAHPTERILIVRRTDSRDPEGPGRARNRSRRDGTHCCSRVGSKGDGVQVNRNRLSGATRGADFSATRRFHPNRYGSSHGTHPDCAPYRFSGSGMPWKNPVSFAARRASLLLKGWLERRGSAG